MQDASTLPQLLQNPRAAGRTQLARKALEGVWMGNYRLKESLQHRLIFGKKMIWA